MSCEKRDLLSDLKNYNLKGVLDKEVRCFLTFFCRKIGREGYKQVAIQNELLPFILTDKLDSQSDNRHVFK